MKLSFIIKSVTYLPGTFLHELSHYAAALLLGKPEGFTVFPRREGNALVFGQVTARIRYKVLGIFIAAAPLVWWLALALLMERFEIIWLGPAAPYVHLTLSRAALRPFSPDSLFFLWLSVQLLWAGRLSGQDIKTLLGGIFCVSGAVTGVFLFLAYKVFSLNL